MTILQYFCCYSDSVYLKIEFNKNYHTVTFNKQCNSSHTTSTTKVGPSAITNTTAFTLPQWRQTSSLTSKLTAFTLPQWRQTSDLSPATWLPSHSLSQDKHLISHQQHDCLHTPSVKTSIWSLTSNMTAFTLPQWRQTSDLPPATWLPSHSLSEGRHLISHQQHDCLHTPSVKADIWSLTSNMTAFTLPQWRQTSDLSPATWLPSHSLSEGRHLISHQQHDCLHTPSVKADIWSLTSNMTAFTLPQWRQAYDLSPGNKMTHYWTFHPLISQQRHK